MRKPLSRRTALPFIIAPAVVIARVLAVGFVRRGRRPVTHRRHKWTAGSPGRWAAPRRWPVPSIGARRAPVVILPLRSAAIATLTPQLTV